MVKKMRKNNYDVIVIGAGNGGLASAATLAEKGKSVAIFEKHNIPGGCGTSFRRGRFEFEVALHQLSSLGSKEKPGDLRKQFERYNIADKIDWIEIKELFRVNFHDGTGISLPADRKKCEEHLCKEFPDEKENILLYFKVVFDFCSESAEFAKASAASSGEPSTLKKKVMKIVFPKKYPTLAAYAMRSTDDVLNEFFNDEKLKLALSAYWCFMGMPPARFPWAILAKCTAFYIEDRPYYLKGTSMMMNQSILESARENGADIYMNCGVNKLLLEGNKVVGVRCENGKEYRAKKVISNISPITTYGSLLEKEQIPDTAKEYLKPYTVGISALTCFIGLDCTPEQIGFNTSFTLNYKSLDANEDFKDAYKLLPDNDPLIATCYTVDDPSVSPEGTSIITAGTLKYSKEWEELTPEQYYKMKYLAGQKIVDRLEAMYPGFKDHIEEIEVATPLTHMRYLNHPGGAIYGYEQDLNQSVFFFPTESKLENLEFASGWVNACGFGPNYIYADKVALKIAEEV